MKQTYDPKFAIFDQMIYVLMKFTIVSFYLDPYVLSICLPQKQLGQLRENWFFTVSSIRNAKTGKINSLLHLNLPHLHIIY